MADTKLSFLEFYTYVWNKVPSAWRDADDSMGQPMQVLVYTIAQHMYYYFYLKAVHMEELFDPMLCPEKYLKFLASLLDWKLVGEDPTSWREQLSAAPLLYKIKGTEKSIHLAEKLIGYTTNICVLHRDHAGKLVPKEKIFNNTPENLKKPWLKHTSSLASDQFAPYIDSQFTYLQPDGNVRYTRKSTRSLALSEEQFSTIENYDILGTYNKARYAKVPRIFVSLSKDTPLDSSPALITEAVDLLLRFKPFNVFIQGLEFRFILEDNVLDTLLPEETIKAVAIIRDPKLTSTVTYSSTLQTADTVEEETSVLPIVNYNRRLFSLNNNFNFEDLDTGFYSTKSLPITSLAFGSLDAFGKNTTFDFTSITNFCVIYEGATEVIRYKIVNKSGFTPAELLALSKHGPRLSLVYKADSSFKFDLKSSYHYTLDIPVGTSYFNIKRMAETILEEAAERSITIIPTTIIEILGLFDLQVSYLTLSTTETSYNIKPTRDRYVKSLPTVRHLGGGFTAATSDLSVLDEYPIKLVDPTTKEILAIENVVTPVRKTRGTLRQVEVSPGVPLISKDPLVPTDESKWQVSTAYYYDGSSNNWKHNSWWCNYFSVPNVEVHQSYSVRQYPYTSIDFSANNQEQGRNSVSWRQLISTIKPQLEDYYLVTRSINDEKAKQWTRNNYNNSPQYVNQSSRKLIQGRRDGSSGLLRQTSQIALGYVENTSSLVTNTSFAYSYNGGLPDTVTYDFEYVADALPIPSPFPSFTGYEVFNEDEVVSADYTISDGYSIVSDLVSRNTYYSQGDLNVVSSLYTTNYNISPNKNLYNLTNFSDSISLAVGGLTDNLETFLVTDPTSVFFNLDSTKDIYVAWTELNTGNIIGYNLSPDRQIKTEVAPDIFVWLNGILLRWGYDYKFVHLPGVLTRLHLLLPLATHDVIKVRYHYRQTTSLLPTLTSQSVTHTVSTGDVNKISQGNIFIKALQYSPIITWTLTAGGSVRTPMETLCATYMSTLGTPDMSITVNGQLKTIGEDWLLHQLEINDVLTPAVIFSTKLSFSLQATDTILISYKRL